MAFSGAQVTRIGLYGGSRSPYGSFAGKVTAPPVFTGTIPDISLTESTGTTDYDLSTYFTGATSYSIAPPVEAGWTFNTSTGVLTVDTDAVGSFGPYVVTGINAGGTADSNSFGVVVNLASLPGGSSDKARKYLSEEEIARLRKVYAKAKGLLPEEEKAPQIAPKTEKKQEARLVPDRQFTVLKHVETPVSPVNLVDDRLIKEARRVENEEITREIEALETHIAQHKQWADEEAILLLIVA